MKSGMSKFRENLIKQISKFIELKLENGEIKLLEEFISVFFSRAFKEEISGKSIEDLYGTVVSMWRFIKNKNSNTKIINVFNPKYEEHGWQSPHTVIEILSDNLPFVIDSIRIAIKNLDINIHVMIDNKIRVIRNKEGIIEKFLQKKDEQCLNEQTEMPIYIEIDKQNELANLKLVENILIDVLDDIHVVYTDWQPMRHKMIQAVKEINENKNIYEKNKTDEYISFLKWIEGGNFTLLGYAEHIIQENNKVEKKFMVDKSSLLGLMKKSSVLSNKIFYKDLNIQDSEHNNKQLMLIGKTEKLSTVHRLTYMDIIFILKYNKKQDLVAICSFIGLYTAVAYNSNPKDIPLLREKVKSILELAELDEDYYDQNALSNIIENLPRDDLFLGSEKDLYYISLGVLNLRNKCKLKIFIRKDVYGKYFSCLVFVPRDRFNSDLRHKIYKILFAELKGISLTFDTHFSESSFARIHFIVRTNEIDFPYDVDAIEKKLIKVSITWQDNLQESLYTYYGEGKSSIYFTKYKDAFSTSYQEEFDAKIATSDITYIEKLTLSNIDSIEMSQYRMLEDQSNILRFKLFKFGNSVPLSDVVPMLENMGLIIISERPYKINISQIDFWINDYKMLFSNMNGFNTNVINSIFKDAFSAIWHGYAENDSFNKLVLSAEISWRQIALLRSFYHYLWQGGLMSNLPNVVEALYRNGDIVKKIINLFEIRFDPKYTASIKEQEILYNQVLNDLEQVTSLSDDKIIRKYLKLIFAIQRTNFYQVNKNNQFKEYFSFKFESAKVPDLPLPLPLFEIFVYSPDMEGIHLRAAKVSRGGIRWSDRREDYRTEVLGLMKAQQTKNAVIVPSGAKGGFVVKKSNFFIGKEELQKEVVKCYQTFIRGLLDLTDNLQNEEIINPKQTVIYDTGDPYLVVAADKGTATFSDLANEISKDYGYWLNDAFASGGSVGYDHKKMGITARGAWESVKKHFLRLNKDIQNESFTVVGIGDMSGDVFGNGMLLSNKIRLVAAFNHLHLFIDPNPDPGLSFKERQRLFNLPHSNWTDYNSELISEGGGVFSRTEKYIKLSKEVKQVFNLEEDKLEPNILINKILKSEFELLWNGGIGTFVKAKKEINSEVGDRANDFIRINGEDLHCKVVGEGGNLGLTQLGRIEFAKKGGILNTDSIDNSAGVNCSDMEVNLKILLNDVIANGDLTLKQRNILLVEMENEIADLVLNNNKKQNDSITLIEWSASINIRMHNRLMKSLEATAHLNREVEFLPDKDEIAERITKNAGLERTEISVIMAYVKNSLKYNITNSKLSEDEHVQYILENSFPAIITCKFKKYIHKHKLRREIIASQLTNMVVDEMGMSFVHRLHTETGESDIDIVKAYLIARKLFDYVEINQLISGLGLKIDMSTKMGIHKNVNRVLRRATRWFLRNRITNLDISKMINDFYNNVGKINNILPDLIVVDKELGSDQELDLKIERLPEDETSKELSDNIKRLIISFPYMFSVLDIAEAANVNNYPAVQVARAYFFLGEKLQINWFREEIKNIPVKNHWEALARTTFSDDTDKYQRDLAIAILTVNNDKVVDECEKIKLWIKDHTVLLKKWNKIISEMKLSQLNFTMFAVALRELSDLNIAICNLYKK